LKITNFKEEKADFSDKPGSQIILRVPVYVGNEVRKTKKDGNIGLVFNK
jgi:hypothetical protein